MGKVYIHILKEDGIFTKDTRKLGVAGEDKKWKEKTYSFQRRGKGKAILLDKKVAATLKEGCSYISREKVCPAIELDKCIILTPTPVMCQEWGETAAKELGFYRPSLEEFGKMGALSEQENLKLLGFEFGKPEMIRYSGNTPDPIGVAWAVLSSDRYTRIYTPFDGEKGCWTGRINWRSSPKQGGDPTLAVVQSAIQAHIDYKED